MARTKAALTPGIDTTATATQNEGSWSSSNLIRWKDGFLEKIDGWSRFLSTACAGVVRGIHAWMDLEGEKFLLLGSTNAMQVSDGTTLYSLSLPVTTHSLTASGGLSATNGSYTITITDAAHGLTTGQSISFPSPVTIHNGSTGVAFYPGETYTVTVLTANTFTIARGTAPTFTSTTAATPSYAVSASGATVTVTFYGHGLTTGQTWRVTRSVSVGGMTIRASTYEVTVTNANVFTFVNASSATTTASASEVSDGTIPMQPISTSLPTATNWYISNFGEIGVFCPENGALYQWQPELREPAALSVGALGGSALGSVPLASGPVVESAVEQVGTLVSNAPEKNGGIIVLMPQAQVMSWRAESAGVQDALLLRWTDAGRHDVWTATATNLAGSYRIPTGSRIMSVLQAGQNTLVFTDTGPWMAQFVGLPSVYKFTEIATGCGLIASKAAVARGGAAFWMGKKGFYKLGAGGGTEMIPCPVWDEVFPNLHTSDAAIAKTWARTVSSYDEIKWHYASSDGDGEIDSYVKVNGAGQWDYGSLVRTAGIDTNVFGSPLEVDGSYRIQKHETGYDDDTGAMSGAFAQSAYSDIGEGEDISFIDEIIPDFKWFGSGGHVRLTLYATGYPAQTAKKHGPYTITPTTRVIPNVRCRARQVAVRIEWAAVAGFNARLGAINYRVSSDGRQ